MCYNLSRYCEQVRPWIGSRRTETAVSSHPAPSFRIVAALGLPLALLVPPNASVAAATGAPPPTCAVRQATDNVAAVGTAMISWLTDQVGFVAPVGSTCPGSAPVDVSQVPIIAVDDLRAVLVPQYIAAVPALDPWGNPYEYRLDVRNPLSLDVMAVRTAGADGAFEGDVYDDGTTAGPDDDQVWYNGWFVRRPPRLDPVSRQLITLATVQNLGVALFSWLTDQVGVRGPEVERALSGASVDLSQITPRTQAEIAALLVPQYIRCVPALDGWGNPYDYRLNDDLLGSPVMAIRSAGSDGTVEGDAYPLGTFSADDLFRDIVWSDGVLYQGPTGPRHLIFSDDFETGGLFGTWSCGPGF
jgi:hypothetical protein